MGRDGNEQFRLWGSLQLVTHFPVQAYKRRSRLGFLH